MLGERQPDGPDRWSETWAAFQAQPVIRALNAWRESDPGVPWWSRVRDPVGHFAVERDRYVRRVATSVVPTNVLLTLDGEWLDGTCASDDPSALVGPVYFDFADRYLDALPEDALLVRIRFHS
ncbi:hypothetical protein GCM10009665_39990 [Kitasatospora nipponensis]|uniref:Uncharacterized protein n=1 Tax=Kitasatospora nipponensis TaxID=258049 RepID=A0ABN1WBZ9_9ACTN